MFRLLPVFVFMTLLLGCGGGSSSNPNPTPTPPVGNADTQAPIITAPADLSLTAEGTEGISSDNQSIADFLSAATATDNVDSQVTVINDAPDVFQVGTTTVTFTASDSAGNQADAASAVVTIVAQQGSSTSLVGKVIDGYVSGATAFLDLNFNKELDSNEPTSISGVDGEFTFDLSPEQLQCAGYVPTVVNVPVGAIDSDFGVVTEPYTMVLPPRFNTLTEEDILNVSPLTSLVWGAIETQLQASLTSLSCDALLSDQAQKEQLVSALETAISDVVVHYNLSTDQIFDDFIAENDASAKETAVKMVKGLKKSLQETLALRAQYPDASWAKVNYYFFSALDGDDLYPNAWYRDLELFVGDTITKQLIKVSEDLTEEIRPILFEKTTVSTVGNAALREEIGYQSRGGDSSPYSCYYKEEVSVVSDQVEYQLVNLGGESNAPDIDSCQLPDFDEQASSRYVFYNSMVNGVDSGAQFTFSPDGGDFPALNNWVNLVDSIGTLVTSDLIDYVQSLPYGFCDSGNAGADFVNRSRVQVVSGNRITLNRSEDGLYERITTYADGTSLTELSTIDTVPGWDNCPLADFDFDGAPDVIDPDDDNDGVIDADDEFPLNSGESIDSDDDGIGNNADADDDNDGVVDINDQYPLDAGNILDSDGDGIVDRDDVAPNNSSVSGAMQVDFSDANALGLGSAIDRDTIEELASLSRPNYQQPDLLHAIAAMLFPKAWADGADFESLTNALGWDENGDLVANVLLSNETKFIAEASVSPDGKYLYLLTSAHIQRALQGVDPESCSIYRVNLVDSSHRCLLTVEQGDVQPRSLNSALRFDNSRGGMVFRADGAALIHGFNWERLNSQPEPCECASGSVWFMTPEGEITDLPRDVGWEAATAIWITDELFAVPERLYDEENGFPERIAIYSAETLQRTQFIDDESANGVNLSLIRAKGAVHWSGHILNPDTLEVVDSGQDGFPIVDQSGEQLFYFNWTSVTDGEGLVNLDLVAEGAESYNWQEQSGVGTDIKYTPLAFSEEHIGFMKVFPPAEPIQSIEGVAWEGGGTLVALSEDRGSLELHGMNSLKLFPSDSLTGAMTLDYIVSSDGSPEARSVTIPQAVFENWRADENAADHINWVLPESEIEGFCVYAYSSQALNCIQMSDYDVRAFDMESDRSTRYDADAVCPDGSCNAFPGVSNVILTNGILRVYFKDSTDHRYYEARASVDELMAQGESALEFFSAENGAGEVNIIAAATKLEPLSPLPLEGITVNEAAPQEFIVDFGKPLSNYAALPRFEIWNGQTNVPLSRENLWSSDRETVTIYATAQGLVSGAEHELRVVDPIFLVNSIRRYEPAQTLSLTPTGVNAFRLASSAIQLNDYNPSTQSDVTSSIDVTAADGAMSVDLSASPLNLQNMTNASAGGNFKAPTLNFELESLPVGSGTASVAINLIDGIDNLKADGERQIFVDFSVDWSSDGVSASITVPAQTVTPFYVTSGGTRVDLEIDNLDADILTVTRGGPSYPASLNVKLLAALNKVDAISPSSLLRAGVFNVMITTTLPIVDSQGVSVSELSAIVRIGE